MSVSGVQCVLYVAVPKLSQIVVVVGDGVCCSCFHLCVCDSATAAVALVGCVFWVIQMGECLYECGALRFVYYDFI